MLKNSIAINCTGAAGQLSFKRFGSCQLFCAQEGAVKKKKKRRGGGKKKAGLELSSLQKNTTKRLPERAKGVERVELLFSGSQCHTGHHRTSQDFGPILTPTIGWCLFDLNHSHPAIPVGSSGQVPVDWMALQLTVCPMRTLLPGARSRWRQWPTTRRLCQNRNWRGLQRPQKIGGMGWDGVQLKLEMIEMIHGRVGTGYDRMEFSWSSAKF